MSQYDFIIGSNPIGDADMCTLQFHQYPIYNRSWTSGYLYFDATTGLISTVEAPPPEVLEKIAAPVMTRKQLFKK